MPVKTFDDVIRIRAGLGYEPETSIKDIPAGATDEEVVSIMDENLLAKWSHSWVSGAAAPRSEHDLEAGLYRTVLLYCSVCELRAYYEFSIPRGPCPGAPCLKPPSSS
jgi:hypothetical protein